MTLAKRLPPALSLLLLACSSADAAPPEPDAPDAPPPAWDASADAAPPEPDAPDAPPPTCDADSVSGIEVISKDVYGGPPYALGYPPYAIDGCLLAYVAGPVAGANAGALLLRDLASGEEQELAPASEEPRRPAISESLVAWEATVAGRRSVRVRSGASAAETITGSFDHAGEPRAGGGGVVLTGWLTPEENGDTDVFLYAPGGGQAAPIAPGPGQQRFADISQTHIAFTDFSEDPDGRFDENSGDLADVVVFDREAGTTAARPREGKQAFPLLGSDGRVGYLGWGPSHPEPKFSEYSLLIGDLAAPPSADAELAHIKTLTPYVRPTARGALAEWIDWPGSAGASLFRRPVDASAPATAVPVTGVSGAALFGPCASTTLTVVAESAQGGAMILRGVARPALD